VSSSFFISVFSSCFPDKGYLIYFCFPAKKNEILGTLTTQ
jgi:hypothetical protein